MAVRRQASPFYTALKARTHRYDASDVAQLFQQVDEARVDTLAARLSGYISTNLPAAFEKRTGLAHYRTNPYVLMTSATVMNLEDVGKFSEFLFNSKLYMALETSFGKQIEAAFVGQYPIRSNSPWTDPPEKLAEFAALAGLSQQVKAQRRASSVWREIDRSCVVGDTRYITSIKSGPNTINDTQVQGMFSAIMTNHRQWLDESRVTYPQVRNLDIVLGLTYGTDRTTNNKENQILVKLLEAGFEEEDPISKTGVLIDSPTRSIRVYRCIGRDFWAFVGRPDNPADAQFVFLEVLLGLAKALGSGLAAADIETRINARMRQLAVALASLQFPRNSLPAWVREDFSESQLFWFATAMTAFYDEGI